MTSKYVYLTIGLFLFSFSLSPVFAKGNDSVEDRMEQKKQVLNDRAMEVKENREEMRENRCEIIEQRIEDKITKYQENKDKHTAWYNAFTDNLSKAITKLEEAGLDVTKLKEDLATLETMVDEYLVLLEDFITALRQTQTHACGESEGAFKEALQAALAKHKLAIQKRREIFAFYKDVVREDIKELRQQYADMKGSNEEDSDRTREDQE